MNEGNTVSVSNISEKREDWGWGSLGAGIYVRIAVIGVLFWYFYRDEIARTVNRWMDDGSWSHGFLIPLFSLYFLNQHKKEIVQLKSRPNYLGLFFLLCCIIVYPINIVHLKFAYGQPVLMIASLGSIVLFLGGWRLVRYTWLPVLYLLFAVPLPDRFYRQVTIPMRELAARVATVLLNIVPGLQASAEGVVINVVYKGVAMEPGLDVAEACSGMRLLMAFLALGVAMAYLHYRPMWQRLVLLASTIPIAILCNVVRVTITGFIYILLDPKYAQGGYHDLLGILMLPLAFGMYGGLAWFMSNLFIEEGSEVVEDIVYHRIPEGSKD